MSGDEIRGYLSHVVNELFGNGRAGQPYGRLRGVVDEIEDAARAFKLAAEEMRATAKAIREDRR